MTFNHFDSNGQAVMVKVAGKVPSFMCKGADKSIRITDVELLHKAGGKSGVYQEDGLT